MKNTNVSRRNRFATAALCFLVPGLGQLHTAQVKKAGMLAAANLAILIASKTKLVILYPRAFPALTLVGAALWLYAISDCLYYAGKERPVSWYNRWYVYLGIFFLFVPTVGILDYLSIAKPFKIPGTSMAPTLLLGDRILVDRSAFTGQAPARGELAAFRYPKDPKVSYIKRVVGLPGDTISFRGKMLYVNDQPIPAQPRESAAAQPGSQADWFGAEDAPAMTIYEEELGTKHSIALNVISPIYAEYGPVVVPDRAYFVLGDNRDRSSDSRAWGMVPADHLIGRPANVWFSYNPASNSIRWNRIGITLE